jgi:hypothetical protein
MSDLKHAYVDIHGKSKARCEMDEHESSNVEWVTNAEGVTCGRCRELFRRVDVDNEQRQRLRS